jgi:hypothetical protein
MSALTLSVAAAHRTLLAASPAIWGAAVTAATFRLGLATVALLRSARGGSGSRVVARGHVRTCRRAI